MPPPLVQLTDIRLTFGGAPLLDGVELSVSAGERVGLVGRNGSGKSTLLRIAAGLVEPDSGERFVDMHWYLWTDVRREWRLGATLMRVTIPVTTTEEDALQVGTSFAQHFFTRVLG